MELESYFEPFRSRIVGMDTVIRTPFGEKPLVYADWIASGRLYWPIEDLLSRQFGPLVGNTHSESSETGSTMTRAYQQAHKILKAHVHAGADDVIITTGFGMTSALAKFQRILGIKIPERLSTFCNLPEEERPVVFITHMEHHSNHTPWLESLADVVILPPGPNLEIQVQVLEEEIAKYRNRRMKIGSFTACSNVTGIETPYHRLAAVMHAHGGYCFVDFAASAPYIRIDMHPPDPAEALDAVFFSPHKFLGGPGSSGVLIFNKNLYHNRIPDHPGGARCCGPIPGVSMPTLTTSKSVRMGGRRASFRRSKRP
jgi:selenocysteine lyase/cysteine desulfurase